MDPIRNSTDKWLEENKDNFKPPVCNKMMHDGQLKVFYVGGPNQRKDFHIELGEEFFYMVVGDMTLVMLVNGKFLHVPIQEGEVFLLPGKIPHSPQRKQDTVGMVIERERDVSEKDCLRYFVDGTTNTLYERWFHCKSLGTQLAPLIKDFFDSEQYKTGKPGKGSILCDPPYEIDSEKSIEMPFSLKEWIAKYKNEIAEVGKKRLYDDSYKSDIIVYGPGEHDFAESATDAFIIQIEGTMKFTVNGKIIAVNGGESLLIPANNKYLASGNEACISLHVVMNPANKA